MVSINTLYADELANKTLPYGVSRFHVWPELENIQELKIAFDFNFNDPEGIDRALYPVSFILKTIQDYGPATLEPNIVVVLHGSEVIALASQNYERYKTIVDRASRLADLGVKFELCVVAASAMGFEPEDFHGFVDVVPLGTYARLIMPAGDNTVIPGAATVPAPLINASNSDYLGKLKSGMTE